MEDLEESKPRKNVFELLDAAKPYVKIVLKYYWILIVSGLLFATYFYLKDRKIPRVYTAEITYLLEDELLNDGGGGGGGGSGILSILGGQSGGGNNKGMLVDLSKSTMLIEMTILKSFPKDKKPRVLADEMLEFLGYRKDWVSSNSKMANFTFEDYKIGTNEEADHVLHSLARGIAPKLLSTKYESGLLMMRYSSVSEWFTYAFVMSHLQQISDFYIMKRMEKAKSLVNFTQRKRDSLSGVLGGQDNRLAETVDQSFGMIFQRGKVPELQAKRDITITSTLYQEAVIAHSQAKMELEKRRPFISPIDVPQIPLASQAVNPFTKSIMWGIIGVILVAGILLGVVFVKEFIAKEKQSYLQKRSA